MKIIEKNMRMLLRKMKLLKIKKSKYLIENNQLSHNKIEKNIRMFY